MLAKKFGGKLKCLACNRYCQIASDQVGFCGVRANDNGKLNLLVNNKPCAIWNDPIEKKPLFHFLPGSKSFSLGTFGCNFACEFCQNFDISQAPQEARTKDPKNWRNYFQALVNRCDSWPPERVVDAALERGAKSISFTYNEPTIFTEYALEVMKLAKKKKLKGVFVTNGYESKECWKALKGKIDAVNIDLKAYNKKFYQKLCKVPDFEPIKESIKIAKKLGIWVEVTTLIIPGWNDNETELKEEAEFLASVDKEMPWHVTAFHPMYKLLDKNPTPPEILVRAREIGKLAGLKHVYCGNVGLSYSDFETTYCPKCQKELIKRVGFSVADNNIIDGKCRFCKEKIKGVWR
ncbi:Radical SAM superfamily protein [Candidatus Bilamarchaeum dharawalense]|uniref:Radical SAM superfamily protein n=1 Tax=Candidatus Bilamarchaeum dharawalense TaxID=2885759 RepID=A0A5E4LS88_9ARCH|nr:Radical SAM superfamily protein [Candidatus Bilamarchaeum dharawalense]